MIKKIILLMMTAIMALSFCACSSVSNDEVEEIVDKKIKILENKMEQRITEIEAATNNRLTKIEEEIAGMKEEMPEKPVISKDEAIRIAKQELSKSDATATVTSEDEDFYYINLDSKINIDGEMIEDGVSCKVHKRTKKVTPLAG